MIKKIHKEKLLLEELNKIIKELDEEIYFSFNEPVEGRICLEKVNNLWIVYFVERGKKHHIKEFNNQEEACINVINRISRTNELSKHFINELKKTLRK